MARYRGILMDADDTIFDFQSANRAAVGALLDEIGYMHPDRYEQYEAINLACWRALEQGTLTPEALKTSRWARFFAQYGIDADPYWAGERFVWLLGGQSILLPGAPDVVRRIAEHRPVVIVTNGIAEVQRRRLAGSPVREYITDIVISQEVGYAKPQREIFDIALKRLGIAHTEALMIGDGPSSDIAGANNAGIDVCFYNPNGVVLRSPLHAEYEVSRLSDIVPIALTE